MQLIADCRVRIWELIRQVETLEDGQGQPPGKHERENLARTILADIGGGPSQENWCKSGYSQTGCSHGNDPK